MSKADKYFIEEAVELLSTGFNDQDYEVSLPAGAASFGDLFFAIINEEHYFFLFLRD